eukprot:4989042-Amphidinium_carterae.1
MTESKLNRLTLPVPGAVQKLELAVRSFRVPRSACVHFVELPRVCTFLFGVYPVGFIRKRLHRWQGRCESLGIGAEHIRRSSEGHATSSRQGRDWLGEVPLESEQSSSVSLLALPVWLLSLDTSPQDVSLAHKGTPLSPARVLCVALLGTVLDQVSWHVALPLQAGVLKFVGLQTNVLACRTLPGQKWRSFKELVASIADESGEVNLVQLMSGLLEVIQHAGKTAALKERCKEVLQLVACACGKVTDILLARIVDTDLSMLPVTCGGKRAHRMPSQYKDAVLSESR